MAMDDLAGWKTRFPFPTESATVDDWEGRSIQLASFAKLKKPRTLEHSEHHRSTQTAV